MGMGYKKPQFIVTHFSVKRERKYFFYKSKPLQLAKSTKSGYSYNYKGSTMALPERNAGACQTLPAGQQERNRNDT